MNGPIRKNHVGIEEKQYPSLSRGLVLWFLLLSLLPLTIVSWISYQQASSALTKAASESLVQSSNLTVNFIQNWFEYRLIELKNQADANENSKLLITLSKGFKKSGQSLAEYVKSSDWTQRVDGLQNNLIQLSQRYDYIYDLFLLDLKGNLLFSVTHKSDLGTNILTGPYEHTLFAHSIKTTLKSGQATFSDLERYPPSPNIITGFLTAPLVDESSRIIGVFAIQIHIDRIISPLKQNLKNNSTLTHYLLGSDGKLRSSIEENSDEVLNRIINSKQSRNWQQHDYLNKQKEIAHKNTAFEYLGPNGKPVIGIHQMLRLPGVTWALISEIELDEVLASAKWLTKITLSLLLLTSIIVIIIAIYLSRRITLPMIALANANMKVAAGELDQRVDVTAKNEIGQLATAFNHMLEMWQLHEHDLEKSKLQAQEVLVELAEQRFALDQHAIVAITDIKGMITFVNSKFTEISGYNKDELIGKNHRIINSGYHDKSFFRQMYRTIANGEVWHGEICNKAKDGHLYWVDTTIVPFKNEHGKPQSYIAIRTDITERKKTEVELIEAKEAAEASTRLKSEFLANMSHEIRTPMNGVIGMTGLLLNTDLTSRQHNYAESCMQSADALLTIINDILDFSKIEAGKLELENVSFDMQALAEDVAEMMAFKSREKNIEMLLRYKPGTQRFLLGDPGRIRQILLNLLSNAIKFTEQGVILLSIESAETCDNKITLYIKVEDSGIGISKHKLDAIFNKFDQEDGSTTRKYGGTGLGLSICWQLCELMHGNIEVESQKGKGSIFSFTLELEPGNVDDIHSVEAGHDGQLKDLKILIVDDLETAQIILREQLSTLQVRIDTASSGEQAIDKLTDAISQDDPYRIVITDFHMPLMDGEMLAKEINRQGLLKDGALLFVTSSPRKGDGQRLSKIGFDGYLTKPTHPSEVPQILSIIWNAKKRGRAIPLVSRHTLREVKSSSREHVTFSNSQILVAEDNPVNQMVATEYLEMYGCSITPAGNGLEALAMVKEQHFDLIFMDCQMPEMDGYVATAEIRNFESLNNTERIPIIAFTANAMQRDKEECLAAGMDDFISKPINQTTLKNILIKWLPHKLDSVAERTDKQERKINNSNRHAPGIKPVSSSLAIDGPIDLPVFNKLKHLFQEKFTAAIKQHTENAAENVDRIEQAFRASDIEMLQRVAHSLKGSSAQFGAIELHQTARLIEQLTRAGELGNIDRLINELKITQKKTAEAMMQLINPNNR